MPAISAKRIGNYKPGPGRPKGSKNKSTLALEEAARRAAASIDGAFDGGAHAFLQAVYRNPEVPLDVRIMAASRALKVETPALRSTENRVSVTIGLADRIAAGRDRAAMARRGGLIAGTIDDAAIEARVVGSSPLNPATREPNKV